MNLQSIILLAIVLALAAWVLRVHLKKAASTVAAVRATVAKAVRRGTPIAPSRTRSADKGKGGASHCIPRAVFNTQPCSTLYAAEPSP